ncbi:hypothetical protein GJ496_003635 [Pomphorhynchus laevis]|nr:hypothetical protein GJ496_003635 [Pomphorhynchus laevis]
MQLSKLLQALLSCASEFIANKKQSVSMPFEDTTNMQQGINKESIDRYEVPQDAMKMVKYEICGKAGVGNEIKQAGNALTTDTSTQTVMSIQDFLNLDHKPFVISTDDHPLNQFKVINSKNLVQTGESASTVMDENMLYVEEYFCVTCGTRNSSICEMELIVRHVCTIEKCRKELEFDNLIEIKQFLIPLNFRQSVSLCYNIIKILNFPLRKRINFLLIL